MMPALHGCCVRWVRDFASDRNRHSSRFYRIITIPTITMIAIVILAVVKPF